MPIENGAKIPMTFELLWFPTEHQFKDRFDNYLDVNLFEHQVHFTVVSTQISIIFNTSLLPSFGRFTGSRSSTPS